MDGTDAIVSVETAAGEAAGAYPITPASNMGEGWAQAYADGALNVHGRRLLFFEPEGEHAAAGVTAGMSMVGLRSSNFSAGQGIAYMHESLYAAVGKRLTYVLNIACRAMTKQALNIHAGHDDYHAVDDTGFFQLFGKNAQEAADLNLIAHRVAELSLNPGICAQDGFLTSHVIETLRLPERDLIRQYLGDPADIIECPTAAQRLMFGETRRRIPELFDLDNPALLGPVQNQDSYAQGVAAQRPFFFDHIAELTDQAMAEFAALTGRHYSRAIGYRLEDAEYVVLGQGSIVSNLEAVVDHLRDQTGLAIGVLNLTMFRPFPSDQVTQLLKGKKAVTVLERVDQPLAVDLPVLREVRAAVGKALENGRAKGDVLPYPDVVPYRPEEAPDFFSGCFGLGSRDTQPGDLIAAVDNMVENGRRMFYLAIDFVRSETRLPGLKTWQGEIAHAYPRVGELALHAVENPSLMPPGSLSLRIHSVGGWGAITTVKNLAMTLFQLLGLHVKANPKYGSEKKGQPTTFYATFAHDPIRLNCQLSHVDVVLSPDPNVFGHSDPFAGLEDEGVFIIQWDQSPEALWSYLPGWARRTIRERKLKVFHLDAFAIARDEASDPGLQYRMQGAAFQGAFFRASPLMEREGLPERELFDAIRAQLQAKFGHKGPRVVEDNVRVIRRGWDELKELDWQTLEQGQDSERFQVPSMPPRMQSRPTGCSFADAHRFFDQVGAVYATGEEPVADPYAALSAMPAVTSVLRNMTDIRFEVPVLVPDKCTGCGQCWTVCPDTAIPGLVSDVDVVLRTALEATQDNGDPDRSMSAIVGPLADETRKVLKTKPFSTFAKAVELAWGSASESLNLPAN
jgi:pyruvate-ferredoxin/flavodoxin oxidoreductase